MIRWNDESVDAQNQKLSYCEQDRQVYQRIFYQFKKDHKKIAIDNI